MSRFAPLSLMIVPFVALGCASPAPAPVASDVAAVVAAPSGPSIVVTPEMGSPHIGDSAPDFELSDQDGKPVKLSSLQGSVVVLAFVTSWCPYSKAEQPFLASLAHEYESRGVKFVAVDIKEDDAAYKEYLARVAMPFPVLHDADGAVTAKFTPEHAQPHLKNRATVIVTSNLVIDQHGKIAFFTLVDTAHFDAKLDFARKVVDDLLGRTQ